MDQTTLNNNMIDGQIRPINGISKEVISAFSSVNRSDFVPEDLILRSYTEKNLKLSSDRYLLRPNLIGEIINHVSPKNSETILVLPASINGIDLMDENLLDRIPLNRYGKPSEVANVILFLTSSFASYITGATILVDGGFSIN